MYTLFFHISSVSFMTAALVYAQVQKMSKSFYLNKVDS